MAITIKNPMRLRGDEEANGSYAGDLTGNLPGFIDIPFMAGTFTATLNEDRVDPGMFGQTLDHRNKRVKGVRSATATFSLPIAAITTSPAAAAAIAQSPLGLLLKIGCGGESLGTARAVTTAATTTSVPVTTSAGLNVGSAIAFATGSGSTLEARPIHDNAGDAIVPKFAFTAAPSDAALCHPSATYYLGGTLGSQTTFLQLIAEGLNVKDRYVLYGGQFDAPPTLSNIGPSVTPGAVPTITFTWRFANWLEASEATGSANLAGALGRATYVNNVVNVVKASEFRYQVNGTTTIGPLIQAPIIEWTPSIVYDWHHAPGGVNTVVKPIRSVPEGQAIAIEFVIPQENDDDTWRDFWDDQSDLLFTMQIGSSPTKGCVLLEAPTCEVVNVQPETAGNAITGLRVRAEGGNDGDTEQSGLTGTDLDRALSAFKIHLFGGASS